MGVDPQSDGGSDQARNGTRGTIAKANQRGGVCHARENYDSPRVQQNEASRQNAFCEVWRKNHLTSN